MGRGRAAMRAMAETTKAFVHELYGDVAGYRAGLSAAVEAQPTNYAAAFGIGSSAMQQHRWSKALGWFSHCLELRKGDPPASLNRGVARVMLGRLREAMTDFDVALAGAPHDANVYFNRGVALHKLGQHLQADEQFS